VRDWRQFPLQRGACFGTFNDVRMIVISMVLLAGIPATFAQEQDLKLADRILKPNMSLVNAAQNKQFGAARAVLPQRAPSRNFYTPDKARAKSFPTERTLSPRQFAARHFRAGDTIANISTRSHLAKTDTVSVTSAAYATRVAPETDKSVAVSAFPGDRPFLGQGKSQKALHARDTPLTIEQVRELLNKNK
jgi:hypothetical protein